MVQNTKFGLPSPKNKGYMPHFRFGRAWPKRVTWCPKIPNLDPLARKTRDICPTSGLEGSGPKGSPGAQNTKFGALIPKNKISYGRSRVPYYWHHRGPLGLKILTPKFGLLVSRRTPPDCQFPWHGLYKAKVDPCHQVSWSGYRQNQN